MSSDWRRPLATGREQFHYVFHQGIFSDVNLVIDGVDISAVDRQVIPSHSLVLKVRSPVFEKLLEKVQVGNGGRKEISIQGFEAAEVKKFIQFLYTDELEKSSPHEMQKILHLGKKYKVHGLVSRCAASLLESLSPECAASTLQAAKDHNEIELEGKALQFILSNATEVLENDDFSTLSQINVCEILAKNELDIQEIDLFLGILKWARIECTRYKIQDTPKHIRLVLKEALNLVRFPTITKDDFDKKVIPTEVLNEREITEINRYFNAAPENRQFVTPAMFSCKPRMIIANEDDMDLTNTDEENHKLLIKVALKKARGSIPANRKSVRVSSVIVEIEAMEDATCSLSKLQDEIFKIQKYGLYWGVGSVVDNKLLLSFAAEVTRSYGVGSIIDEIQDRFEDQVKLAFVKSFKEDITIHL